MKIKTKLIISVCTTVVLVVFLISFLNNKMAQDLISKRIYSSEAPAVVAAIAEKFERQLSNSYSTARMIANNPMIHQWIKSGEPEPGVGSLAGLLKVAKDQGVDFTFVVSDLSKKYYVDTGIANIIDPNNPKDGWYFDTIKGGQKESISVDPSQVGNGLMAFINIFMGSKENFIGIAGAGINLSSLSQQLSETKLSPGGVTYLVGKKGNIFACSEGFELYKVENINKIDNGEYYKKIAQRLLDKPEGFFEYADRNEQKNIVVFREIPSTGWKVVTEASVSELTKELGKIRNINYIILICSILLLFIIVNLLANAILKSVRHTVMTLEEISKGDITRRMEISSKDEMGQLGVHFNVFMDRTYEMISKITNIVHDVDDTSSNVVAISTTLADTSTSTLSQADQATSSCRNAQSSMENISENVTQISSNVDKLSLATNEMTNALHGVVENTSQTREATDHAVSLAETAANKVENLEKAAIDIFHVVDTIADISDQVNLLALNATIEAARAGEAGKGFAVVANEIKELAHQTNQATEDIKQRTEGIRTSTSETGESMDELNEIIQNSNKMAAEIADAAKTHLMTTQRISNSIQEISSNMALAQENAQNSVHDSDEAVNNTQKIIQDAEIILQENKALREGVSVLKEATKNLNNLLKFFKI